MPREGVPYPERLLCSIRCELKNLWAALSGKLHSINGVEGDGQGNVTIVSENAALTVNDYPLSNQIGIDLDTSLLPAAAVDSVCGKTGTVVLYAQDIGGGVVPGVTVRNELTTLAGDNYQNAQDILAEATARSNADTALQTNINAEASARSSADGNLQSQINALPTNADVTQAVQDGLDNYATMLRTVDNQAFTGIKSPEYNVVKEFVNNDHPSGSGWKRLFICAASSSGSQRRATIEFHGTRSTVYDTLSIVYSGLSGAPSASILLGSVNIRVCRMTNGDIEVWTSDAVYAYVLMDAIRTAGLMIQTTAALSDSFTTEPTVGGDFAAVVTPGVVIQ